MFTLRINGDNNLTFSSGECRVNTDEFYIVSGDFIETKLPEITIKKLELINSDGKVLATREIDEKIIINTNEILDFKIYFSIRKRGSKK